MRKLRAVKRLCGAVIITVGGSLILWWFGVRDNMAARRHWQLILNQAMIRNLGITMHVEGTLAQSPTLCIANHCSYLDVFVLGSVGHMRFTPKSEVKRWPVIGRVIQAFDVIFVDRSRAATATTQANLYAALHGGSRICVFPEGTTNNGRALKPFKSSLLSLAEQWDGTSALTIQPIAIQYDRIDGMDIRDTLWDIIAWYGDASLLPHAWKVCQCNTIEVTVHCLPATTLHEDESRKALTARIQTQIHDILPAGT